MKLYLHIGTEKTGSSFLQSYLAKNRSLLLKHGIHFPKAGFNEANMLKGKISPGNADELDKFLAQQDWEQVKTFLSSKLEEAKDKNCKAILLSNEILVLRFAEKDVLNQFTEIATSLHFEVQELLLMVREPISQALSLYKHRSKIGIMLPVNQWLNENYILADSLLDFYKRLLHSEVGVLQYPYQKNSAYLVEVCINKWLKLNEKIEIEHTTVNPSLTLSELRVLCELHPKNPYLAKKYYDFMIQLNTNLKSDDQLYKTFVKDQMNNYMVNYNSLWETVHQHMSCESNLYHYQPVKVNQLQETASFSVQQIEMMSSFIMYTNSWSYYKFQITKKVQKAIVKIIPKFLNDFRKRIRDSFYN